MAGTSRPRPGGSRPAVGRPRGVAGRRPATAEVSTSSTAESPEVEPSPVVEPVETRGRLLRGLTVAAVVLALVGVGEAVYLLRDPTPTVSASRPVVTGDLAQRAAVETAARSTEQILSTSYQDYEGQVAQATTKMTDTFAREYRATADGLADKYAEQRLKLTVKAVAQGVVQASPSQVKALLFLNQYVEKVVDGKPSTSFAQYRALVTVVHTDHGWLVSDLQTQ